MAGIDLAAFKANYARMSDYDLADLHALGPSGVVSPEIWELVEDEFRRRGTGVVEVAQEAVERRASEAEVAIQVAEVFRRMVPWYTRIATAGFDIAILSVPCGLIALVLGGEISDGIGAAILLYIVFYQPVSELFWQRSFAMRQMSQRLVDIRGGKPSTGQVLGRSILRPLGGSGLLWYALWGTPWLHDGMSRTRVVNERATRASGCPDSDA